MFAEEKCCKHLSSSLVIQSQSHLSNSMKAFDCSCSNFKDLTVSLRSFPESFCSLAFFFFLEFYYADS